MGVWGTFRSPNVSMFQRSNDSSIYPHSFHTVAHSSAHFCTPQKLNSFIFKRFRTLCKKTGVAEEDKLPADNTARASVVTSLLHYILTSLRPYLLPRETASARRADYRRWLRVPGTAAGAAPAPSPSIPSGC